MEIGSDFDLNSDIKSIRSTVANYLDKHKIKSGIVLDNNTINSRMSFILFQFKNIFF